MTYGRIHPRQTPFLRISMLISSIWLQQSTRSGLNRSSKTAKIHLCSPVQVMYATLFARNVRHTTDRAVYLGCQNLATSAGGLGKLPAKYSHLGRTFIFITTPGVIDHHFAYRLETQISSNFGAHLVLNLPNLFSSCNWLGGQASVLAMDWYGRERLKKTPLHNITFGGKTVAAVQNVDNFTFA